MTSAFLGAAVPAAVIGEAGGVKVLVTVVELWSDGVVVRVAAVPSERTDALQAEYLAEEMRRWDERRRTGRDDWPWHAQPAERLVRHQLHLDDGEGTHFEVLGSESGGTGHEWRAAVLFRGGVHRNAECLRLTMQVDAGLGRVDVPLPMRE